MVVGLLDVTFSRWVSEGRGVPKQAQLISYYGSHLRWLTKRQAESLVEAGHAKRISRLKDPVLKVRMTFPIRRNGHHYCDPTSITFTEVMANAGLSWNRKLEQRAKDKVNAWQDEQDTKAPLANSDKR